MTTDYDSLKARCIAICKATHHFHLVVGSLIGHGNSGAVFHASDERNSSLAVCLKIMKTVSSEGSNGQEYNSQRQAGRLLNKPESAIRVPQVYQDLDLECSEGSFRGILMEYHPSLTLATACKQIGSVSSILSTSASRHALVKNIGNAMLVLLSNGMIHCDLFNHNNILLQGNHAILIDWDRTCHFHDAKELHKPGQVADSYAKMVFACKRLVQDLITDIPHVRTKLASISTVQDCLAILAPQAVQQGQASRS